jgi:hypothetical protein
MFGLRDINVEKIGNPDTPDLVYYNLDIINGKTIDEGLGKNPTARFNETRDTAIIKDTSQYYFSIVRFNMDGSDKTLPIFIPQIDDKQLAPANVNKTIYQLPVLLSVSYNGKTQSFQPSIDINVYWKPQNLTAIPPALINDLIVSQEVSNPYYFCYDINHFLSIINKYYEDLWNDLNTQFREWLGEESEPVVDLTTKPPVIVFDENTGLMSYNLDTYGFGGSQSISSGGLAEENFRLFMNSNAWGLFSHFSHIGRGGDLAINNGIGDGYNYEILCKGIPECKIIRYDSTTSLTPSATPSFWVLTQQHLSTTTLWNPISSIVFISTLIPVLNEQTGQPIKYGSGNVVNSVGTQSAFQPIITDIALPMTGLFDYTEFVSYVPSAEYRLSTLSNSPQEVRNIDIQVYWKNRLNGELYPIELFNLSNIQVKMLFRRRDYQH